MANDSNTTVSYTTAIGYWTQATGAGSVAIGVDSSGTAATTAVANEIKLGTANHTTHIPGKLKIGTLGSSGAPLLTLDASGLFPVLTEG